MNAEDLSDEARSHLGAIQARMNAWLDDLPPHWKTGKRLDELCTADQLEHFFALESAAGHSQETFWRIGELIYTLGPDGGARAVKRQTYNDKTLSNFRRDFDAEAQAQVKAFNKRERVRRPSVRSVIKALELRGGAHVDKSAGYERVWSIYSAHELAAMGLRDPRPKAKRPAADTGH